MEKDLLVPLKSILIGSFLKYDSEQIAIGIRNRPHQSVSSTWTNVLDNAAEEWSSFINQSVLHSSPHSWKLRLFEGLAFIICISWNIQDTERFESISRSFTAIETLFTAHIISVNCTCLF